MATDEDKLVEALTDVRETLSEQNQKLMDLALQLFVANRSEKRALVQSITLLESRVSALESERGENGT